MSFGIATLCIFQFNTIRRKYLKPAHVRNVARIAWSVLVTELLNSSTFVAGLVADCWAQLVVLPIAKQRAQLVVLPIAKQRAQLVVLPFVW